MAAKTRHAKSPAPDAAGAAKVTLADIAKAMGLSISTISMALSDDPEISSETRRKVRETALRLGYTPRRKKQPTNRFSPQGPGRLALITVGYDEEPSYVQEMLRTIVTISQQRNCRVELADVPRAPVEQQFENIRKIASGVDGILLEGFFPLELVQRVIAAAIPMVMLGHVQGDPLMPAHNGFQVIADSRAMAYRATQMMIARGAKRPGIVLVSVIDNLWGFQCLAGYRHALADAGITVDPRRIKQVQYAQHAGYPGLPFESDCVELSKHSDAIVFVNTNVMRNFIQWAQTHQFTLPDERMVIGSSAGAIASASLTRFPSVSLDSGKMALMGIELLLAVLERRITTPGVVVVPHEVHEGRRGG